MRVLFAHNLPQTNELDKRKLDAKVNSIKVTLESILKNSFEIVIRDQQSLQDHLYDYPKYSNLKNQ
jgi:hypothetical protein